MSEAHWLAIFERIRALPEHQQARLCWGNVTMLVERRGQVVVAMREVSAEQRRQTLRDETSLRIEEARDCQFLYFAGKHVLCSWRRQPMHWDWLQALAAVEI